MVGPNAVLLDLMLHTSPCAYLPTISPLWMYLFKSLPIMEVKGGSQGDDPHSLKEIVFISRNEHTSASITQLVWEGTPFTQ